MSSSRYSWADMATSWRADFAVWLVLMLWLTGYRLLLAISFTPDLPWSQLPRGLLEGSRFDSVLASAVVLPGLVWAALGLIFGRAPGLIRLRRTMVILVCLAAGVVYGADFEYFRNLGTHFDQRVLALVNDGDGAIGRMIWQAHHPMVILFLSLASGLVMAWTALTAAGSLPPGWPAQVEGRWARGFTLLLAIILIIGALRGFSWSVSPVRIRNAYVTTSMELNRSIPSPVAYWLYAMENRGTARAGVSKQQVAQALTVHARAQRLPPVAGDLAAALVQVGKGSARPPRHVFVLLLEGQHGYPLLPAWRALDWLPHLARLADRGAYFPNFVPSGAQTDNTLGALVSGVLTPDFVIMYDSGAQRPTLTALAPQFQRLGYHTRFFYGGYPGWSGLDLYIHRQGFSEMHGAANIPDRTGNAWGAWDGELLNHVLDAVTPDRPSLNFILTSSNHSPFDLPAALLPPAPVLPDWAARWDAQTRRILDHERYVDREVGRFIAAAEKKFPDALFVITGDHTAYGGRFELPGNPALERFHVPMILYGAGLDQARRGRHDTPASHLDIAPTLLDLCAPRGHPYASLGMSLFAPKRPDHALGHDRLLGAGWWADAQSETAEALEPGRKPDQGVLRQAREHHAATRVLSRALLGPILE